MPSLNMDFGGFNEILKRIDDLDGSVKKITEEAERAAFKVITRKAEDAIQKPNLPRQGRYSSGRSERSLVRDAKITWNGDEASVSVGFNIRKGGLPTIFMIYGTPRYMKSQVLYDAFYGEQTEQEVYNAVKDAMEQGIREAIG